MAGNGRVYGLAAPDRLFVFDPDKGAFIHDETLKNYGRFSGGQAPRTMALGPSGEIYILFDRAIVRLDPETLNHREIARLDREISAGIVVHDNRLYFASLSRLFSFDLKKQ